MKRLKEGFIRRKVKFAFFPRRVHFGADSIKWIWFQYYEEFRIYHRLSGPSDYWGFPVRNWLWQDGLKEREGK